MLPLMTRSAPEPDRAAFQAGEVLNGLGITGALPELLLQDASGRSFEPIQLSPDHDLAEQFGLLIRAEPVGGAEQLIFENRQRLAQAAELQLSRVLASVSQAPRSCLSELARAARGRLDRLTERFEQIDLPFRQSQERLQRWQARQSDDDQGAGGTLWRWLFGGGEQISLPEAVALWNKREYQALQRSALLAAIAIASSVVEQLSTMLAQVDARLTEADAALAALRAEQARLEQAAPGVSPWTIGLHTPAIASALAEQSESATLLAELLGRFAKASETPLAEHARALAAAAAEQQLARLSIAEVIELEARAGEGADDDPLVPLGQSLLAQVQEPTWQLARGARPRAETLQVTPDGAPLYSLEGLGSAAYGGDQLCLAFIQVQLSVAQEELALLNADEQAFQTALSQRNLYVVPELAEAWEQRQLASPAAHANGHAPAIALSEEGLA